jgi:hypothetical protein
MYLVIGEEAVLLNNGLCIIEEFLIKGKVLIESVLLLDTYLI